MPSTFQASPTLSTWKVAALLSCLLSGCEFFQSYPGEAEVQRWVGPGCTLVSVGTMQSLRENQAKAGLKRVAFPYQADCIAEGGSTARRISAYMVFEQRKEWFLKVWGLGQSHQNLDNEPGVPASGNSALTAVVRPEPAENRGNTAPDIAASGAMTVSTPDCQAYVERFKAQVIPCLEKQRPDLVGPIQSQIDEYYARSRQTANSNLGVEASIARDAQCMEHWHQVNRWLPSGTAPGACGLTD